METNDSLSSFANHLFYNVSFFIKSRKNTDVLLLPKSQANNQKPLYFIFTIYKLYILYNSEQTTIITFSNFNIQNALKLKRNI